MGKRFSFVKLLRYKGLSGVGVLARPALAGKRCTSGNGSGCRVRVKMILHIECRALLNTWGLSVGYNIAAFVLALVYEKIPLSCAARVFFYLGGRFENFKCSIIFVVYFWVVGAMFFVGVT